MKVIKVIVDEIPKGCYECFFCRHHNIKGSEFDACVANTWKETSIIYSLDTRPDWCPLVSVERLEKIVVSPNFDNAWGIMKRIFSHIDESED